MDFDKVYKNKPNVYGNKPSAWVVEIPKYLKKPAKVLDLGVCYGRNAVYLAKKGYEVVGVDISKVALQQCLERAVKNKVVIKCICQDIKDFVFTEEFDAIYSTATLQYLADEKTVDRVVESMKKYTKMGGLNVISIPTSTKIAIDMPLYLSKEKLLDYYKDWQVLDCEEQEDKFSNGKTGTIAHIIARKN